MAVCYLAGSAVGSLELSTFRAYVAIRKSELSNHAQEGLLRWVGRFHAWRRG